MAKLRLTEEEKLVLIEALNNDTEPSPDLVTKLFPSTSEKFDVVSLDRAKVPTLEYAGKRSKAAILAEASAGIGAAPLQVSRCFGEAGDDDWKNMIVQGDNLQFLKTCYRNEDPLIKDKVKGKVKLIYIDPPFATKSDFGGKAGEKSYTDKVVTAEFIESLRERLVFFSSLLDADGSIYVHLDEKMSHYIKVVLDELFGRDRFHNQVIWRRSLPKGNTQGKYASSHDVILMYTKSETYTWKNQYIEHREDYIKQFYRFKEDDGRVYRLISCISPNPNRPNLDYEWKGVRRVWRFEKKKMAEMDSMNLLVYSKNGVPSYKGYLDTMKGTSIQDIWLDIFPLMGSGNETLNYPTQKPEALISRIIETSTNPGDIILDLFAGSGTTPAVAEKLSRRWIACDFGKHAIYTMQRRMLRIAESKALEDEVNEDGKVMVKKGEAYSKAAKSFCVVSSGAYDFSHVMELREHKDNYVNFVLGLFQLVKDTEVSKKFKSDIIFAERNGHPVEVYPVWQDEFLKEIRIDEAYLEGIITQSGGKLKGEYYIITPETCTNIGDTTLKNDNGEEVTFKMLTFPYKVLEDVSRKLTLQDQPSKPEEVNQLISSTAFYFNEDVEIEVKRTKEGLQITHFETKILDGQGNRFLRYSGLAMLLVDDSYQPGKPFDMDKTIFLKDVREDGTIAFAGLGDSIGVIAIDKHGNESKPVKVA